MIWVIIGVSGFLLLLFSVLSEYMFYDSRRDSYYRVQKEIALGHLAGFKCHQEVVVPLLIASISGAMGICKESKFGGFKCGQRISTN